MRLAIGSGVTSGQGGTMIVRPHYDVKRFFVVPDFL